MELQRAGDDQAQECRVCGAGTVSWGKWPGVPTATGCTQFCLHAFITAETTWKEQGLWYLSPCSCFFFPPRPIFYLLAFMPMRNFLNDQFLLLCIFRKAVSLPHGKHDLSVFSVLYFSLVYFRHPVSCHCSEPPRLETAPSRDLERKGHFPSPASPIIMFVM